MTPHLRRLEAIADRLRAEPDALALLALGSVGRDRHRLDEHSDLDFFVIASDPDPLLSDLGWLGDVQWSHRDTPDGCKALVDGLFHEFAVFTPDRFPGVLFEPGVYVWVREGFDTSRMRPTVPPARDPAWLRREILSNLYVGLHRWLRGERLAAMHMVQGQALDNLLRLYGADDPFTPARRAESSGLPLEVLAGGYEATPAAAGAVLATLQTDDPMAQEVRALLQACEEQHSGQQADASRSDEHRQQYQDDSQDGLAAHHRDHATHDEYHSE